MNLYRLIIVIISLFLLAASCGESEPFDSFNEMGYSDSANSIALQMVFGNHPDVKLLRSRVWLANSFAAKFECFIHFTYTGQRARLIDPTLLVTSETHHGWFKEVWSEVPDWFPSENPSDGILYKYKNTKSFILEGPKGDDFYLYFVSDDLIPYRPLGPRKLDGMGPLEEER